MGNIDFGARLKELRKSENETQPMLAEAIGVSRSAISMYESGAREPDFETLEAIADHYNVDMNYLMGWTDDPYDYDRDPYSIFSEIPSEVLKGLRAIYGDDNEAIWKAWQAMDGDARTDSARSEYSLSVKQKPEPQDELDNVYLSFAKQAQNEGIAPEDIRLAIETIKKLRGER